MQRAAPAGLTVSNSDSIARLVLYVPELPMKSLFFSLTVTAVLAALTGCATQPVPTSQATDVPNERIQDRRYLQPAAGSGLVTIKRDTGFGGSACNTSVYANGTLTALLAPSEKISLHLPEGSHVISAWPNNPCGGGMVEVEALVRVNKPLTFRIGYGSNGDFGLYPTAF